jgi:hypothetical protein
MITYSKEAQTSYHENIKRLQAELGNVPTNIINYTDLHWLIHTALSDLEQVVEKEHEQERPHFVIHKPAWK